MDTAKPISNTSMTAVPANSTLYQNRYVQYALSILIFIPALVYFIKVNEYAVNIPYVDDYNAILDFLSQFKTASVGDKFLLLFSQHIDHRIFHSRVVYAIYYYIFGKINFIHITVLGNLQLVVIFLILVHFIRKAIPDYWKIAALIAGICIFDLSNYENATIAMFGMQNYGVIMLFLLSLFFFTKRGVKYAILGIAFEFTTIFSSSNGMFFALFIFLFLLPQKDKRRAIASGITLLVFSALFLTNFTRATSTTESFSFLGDMRFFLLMIGSHFSYTYGVLFGGLILAILIVLLPITVKSRKMAIKEDTLPLVCTAAALLVAIILVSIFRSGLRGPVGAYSSHYLILSHLVVALAFVFFWIRFQGNKIAWPVTIAGTILLLIAYKTNYEYGNGCMAIIRDKKVNVPYCYGQSSDYQAMGKVIAEKACTLDIYCIQDYTNFR